MKKFDAVVMKVLLYELPVLVLFILSYKALPLEHLAQSNVYAGIWYQIGGCYVFGSWILGALYVSVKLLLSGNFRQIVLTRMTSMRERDEREVVLTGQASKNTMLTTLAILIFLFCLSCLQFSYARVPAEIAVPGNTREVSWGLGFSLTGEDAEAKGTENTPLERVIEYNGLPLSTSVILLGLIGWNIFSYKYYMKKYE